MVKRLFLSEAEIRRAGYMEHSMVEKLVKNSDYYFEGVDSGGTIRWVLVYDFGVVAEPEIITLFDKNGLRDMQVYRVDDLPGDFLYNNTPNELKTELFQVYGL